MARSSEKINAHIKPSTSNPDTSQSASKIIMALITSRNIPKVRIVTGSVKMTRIGRTIKLSSDKDSATSTALKYPSVSTPGSTLDKTTTIMAVISNLRMNFIVYDLMVKIKKSVSVKPRRILKCFATRISLRYHLFVLIGMRLYQL